MVAMKPFETQTPDELLAQLRAAQHELRRRGWLSPSMQPSDPSAFDGLPEMTDSEQRYYLLYDNNPSMYFTLSPNGRVLSVNRFGAEQLGYVQDDLIGESVLRVFDPGDHATVLEQLAICTRTPSQTFVWEIGKVRQDGTKLWVKERARCVISPCGDSMILIVCEDITDRKQAEAVLQESEQRLRLMIECAPECVAIVSPDGRLQSINPAGLLILEAEATSEVCGHPLFEFIHPDDRPAFQRFHEAAASGHAGRLNFRMRGLHGTERLVESHGVPWRDNARNVTAVLSVTHDVTQQRRTEQALRESEARLNFLLSKSPAVIYTAEVSGNYAITFVSGNVDKHLGYEPREFIQDPRLWVTRIHPEDAPRVLANLAELFSQGTLTYEYRFLHKSGGYRWLRDDLILIADDQGNPVEILGSWTDITERRRAEEERERFSQDLHDDILQSLYAVGMQLEASKLTACTAPRRSKSHVTQAIDHLNRLVVTVRQFIALLNQETSPARDFGQALRQLADSFTLGRRTKIELDIQDAAAATLSSEQGAQLLSIAREALSNGLRHAQASRLWMRLTRTGRTIRLKVGDDGIGFDSKQKRHQGHGLINMAARAKRVHGRFRLTSTPGRGTCITVEFVREERHAHETQSPSPAAR